MHQSKRRSLQRSGWTVGTVEEFLGLTPEESAMIEMRLAMARSIRERRLAKQLTQAELGRQLGSSQSRVAKMEAADATVSIDLLVRSLLKMGASRQEVGRLVGRAQANRVSP